MKKKNLSHFFYGCIAGVVLSSVLFFLTHYAGDLSGLAQRRFQGASYTQWQILQRTNFFVQTVSGWPLGIENGVLEQKSRHLLLPVVFSSLNQSALTFRTVQRTWGQTTSDWVLALGNAGLEQHEWLEDEENLQDHLLIAEKCQDFSSNGTPSPENMFCLTSAIYEAYLFRYDWFVIIPDTTYLAINRLSNLLAKLDPSLPFYIGNPSSTCSRKRFSFICDRCSTHCSMKNGVILSRAALQEITPQLSWCLREKSFAAKHNRKGRGVEEEWNEVEETEKEKKEREAGDKALGCCMKKVLLMSCSDTILTAQVDPSALFLSYPTNSWLHGEFVSLGPISNFNDMLAVHLHTLSTEMWAYASKANRYAHLARQGCLQLPESNSCNLTAISTQSFVLRGLMSHFPKPHQDSTRNQQLWDLVRWETVKDKVVFNSEMYDPARKFVESYQQELRYISMKALEFLGDRILGLSLVQIQTAYLRHSGYRGREYILDLEMERKEEEEKETWRCYLILPPTSGMIFIETFNTKTVDEQTIEFIVPLSNVNNRLTSFLKMYKNLCLMTEEACSLNLVVYGKNDTELARKYLQTLKTNYPGAKLNLIQGSGMFSRGRALELGINGLPDSSLIFMCDVDMFIQPDFLRHCQRNALQGKQVYYPELFKYYNMNYVYRFSRKPKGILGINRKHGHWSTYGYGMLCIYKSDYISAGGFDLSIEGWGGEDVYLAKSILNHNMEVFRAPDPALSHNYHDKVCSTTLTAQQFASCISSRNIGLADKSQLAEYVFYLEDNCQIKQWNLWGS